MRFRHLIVAVALAAAAACSHNPPPALVAAQGSHDVLAAAQDLEAQLCWGITSVAAPLPAGATRTHCTAPTAATVGLTDANHQKLNAALAQAFALHLSATQLAAKGLSVDTSSFNAELQSALDILTALQQSPLVSQIVADINKAKGGQ